MENNRSVYCLETFILVYSLALPSLSGLFTRGRVCCNDASPILTMTGTFKSAQVTFKFDFTMNNLHEVTTKDLQNAKFVD